jgi:hypothetical protein
MLGFLSYFNFFLIKENLVVVYETIEFTLELIRYYYEADYFAVEFALDLYWSAFN